MKHTPSAADLAFVQAFEACTLSTDDFDHRGHLRLAYVYLSSGSLDQAAAQIRAALKAFIAHNGVPADKYHETLTISWLKAVRFFMNKAQGSSSFDNFLDQDARLLDSAIMLTHYSKGRLFSESARRDYLAADLAPIQV